MQRFTAMALKSGKEAFALCISYFHIDYAGAAARHTVQNCKAPHP